MVAFAFAIYGLIIFPRGQGYIETVVVEVFQHIQHGSNPSLAILAETFRSLNYYRRNKDACFLGVYLCYTYGSGAISSVKGSPS